MHNQSVCTRPFSFLLHAAHLNSLYCFGICACIDVVRAYKGLLKEKEALEASLKALSIQQLEDEPQEDKDKADGKGGGGDEGVQDRIVEESGEKDSSPVSCAWLQENCCDGYHSDVIGTF